MTAPRASLRIVRTALAGLAPRGGRGRLSTLIFHRVLEAPDPLAPGEVTADDFGAVLAWCQDLFNVVPLSAAVAGLKSGELPERALVITFDDGYADNHDVAAPLLRRFNLPATFFIATRYLDGGRMFNDDVAAAVGGCSSPLLDLSSVNLGSHSLATLQDRRAALARLLPQVKVIPPVRREEVVSEILAIAGVVRPPSPMMHTEQVASLKRQGFEIGAHTASHPILARLDSASARQEIELGRSDLERITGAPVRFFAYPNGRPGEDFNAETVRLVRQLGFDAAFSTAPGVATARSDPFQLPRFTPWDRSPLRFAMRMVRNVLNSRPHVVEDMPSSARSVPAV